MHDRDRAEAGRVRGSFDQHYLDLAKTRVPRLPAKLAGPAEVDAWVSAVPLLKHEMGLVIARRHKYEREAQQLMVKENNFSALAGQTDYYICDMEYAFDDMRFDLVAVRWPSTSQGRKNADELDLAFIEMKYGDGALTGDAGLQVHVQDVARFATPVNLKALKEEMLRVFSQKYELGLVQVKKAFRSFSDRKPEFILVLANHDPGLGKLRGELEALEVSGDFPVDVRVAVANFLGYGLFEGNVFSLEEFRERFAGRI